MNMFRDNCVTSSSCGDEGSGSGVARFSITTTRIDCQESMSMDIKKGVNSLDKVI